MTQPFTPTPDMLAILAEVESNPNSKFLKLPIHLGNPGTYTQTLTGTETFLTSAEKKLVRSYRGEMEIWLYYRAMRMMAEAPGADRYLVNSQGMIDSADRAIKNRRDEIWVKKGWSRCCASRPLAMDTAHDCLQSSLRLIPNPSAQVLLGLEAAESGRLAYAHGILSGVLRSNHSKTIRAFAAMNLGFLYWEAFDYRSASKAYGWAADLDPSQVQARIFALVCSGLSGEFSQVLRNSSQLTEMGITTEEGIGKSTLAFCDVAAKEHAAALASRRSHTEFSLSKCPDIAKVFILPFASNL